MSPKSLSGSLKCSLFIPLDTTHRWLFSAWNRTKCSILYNLKFRLKFKSPEWLMAAMVNSAALGPCLTFSSSKHFFLPELILLVHYLLFMVCLPSRSMNSVAVGGLNCLVQRSVSPYPRTCLDLFRVSWFVEWMDGWTSIQKYFVNHNALYKYDIHCHYMYM